MKFGTLIRHLASRHLLCLVSLLALGALGDAVANPRAGEQRREGTVQKARSSGRIALGYREYSVPFSYLSGGGEPIGYSIDLCRVIVDAVARKAGRQLTIDWVKVTSDSRLDAVASGEVDLECGSTTNNAERARQVAFSPIIFVAGTKLMTRRDSSLKSFRDLGNSIVSVTSGTTNEKVLFDLRKRFDLAFSIVASEDHETSLELLLKGQADALATDDVLLSGLIATHQLQKEYRIVGDFLSYDPYGIMYGKNDPEMDRIVESVINAMAQRRELDSLYDKWFMRRLPTGERIDLPMSPHLEAIFRVYGEKPK